MADELRSGVAPVTSAERIGELDALRGFALLGVLLANLGWWTFSGFTSIPEQRDLWMSDDANRTAILLLNWLVSDKANTLFGVLFGIGFWVMYERLKAKGGDFNRIYLRRLGILFIFGWAHMLFFWPWDILHMYATMGFALFALRGLSMRAMIGIGLTLAVFARPTVELIRKYTGVEESIGGIVWTPEAQAARQEAVLGNDYGAWFNEYWTMATQDYILSGVFIGWWLYVLGRFLVGAWIARQGWLQRTTELLPQIRKLCLIALPTGLALEALYTAIEFEFLAAPLPVAKAIHATGVPILDLGYACGIILLFNSKSWSFLAKLFAPVGRMALTNYVTQSFLYFFLITGVGPGLAQAGKLAPSETLPICFAFFAAQVVFSHFWLKAYRYGPLEWMWRALTYGEVPAMRRKKEKAAQPA
ncbi:DUF418 domain-containing protein [Sphingomicrobium sediminis]|uniref:DUF418 domain-containing protein n=1 Tax=Sphingomicrobium sediminis TaxID=2950949 RepID=A0A9X2J433_9SPHN|nr:DUF418 domain-containing protein [Sphingomicrobium sediminis]MCM8557951.1 DUF418 domain-containing protein [Sphingomicrobium sediminis]